MKKLTEEQKKLLEESKIVKQKSFTPLEALSEIKKQCGNIHIFTDEVPPRQTTIELRNSGLFEIIDKELWESEKYKYWVKELLEDKKKYNEIELVLKQKVMPLVNLEDSESGICVNGRFAVYDNELYASNDLTEEEYKTVKEWLEK